MTYKPKMRIMGAGGGGSGEKPHTPYEAPNTLQAVVKGRILDLIAYGPIFGLANGLKSVYLEDTPVQNEDDTFNFEGIKMETRVGLPDQDYIPGFAAVENTAEINTEVLFENPPVRSVSNSEADAVVVTIQLAALVQSLENGDSVNASVTVFIDYRSGTGAWVTGASDTITGKTTSPFPKSYRVELEGPGPFSIRVRRGSKESSVNTYQDKMSWTLLTEIIDRKFSYPNMALVGITVNSKLFGTSMPSRSYDMKLSIISVPSNYDPDTRTYTGIWNGTFKQAWTDNPAWAFYDLATHPVIGADIKFVDKWLLYRIAQYCDELVPDGYGGMEPRFTINTIFAAEEEAQIALSSLASVFRGMAYWGSNTMVPVGDMPTSPTKIVTLANVVDGEINYVGTAMSERHSVCTVMWNDPNDKDNAVPEVYEDADSIVAFGWRETRITAVGCNSRGQALRMAKWVLYSERMETQTITYKATLDHADVRPGDIIEVADPDHQGARMAGRITVAGLQTLTLDSVPGPEVLAITANWLLSVLMPDGTVVKQAVSSFTGNQVKLLKNLPMLPEAGFMWALSATELNLPQFRVVSSKEDASTSTYTITATEYDPNKYAFVEQGLKLPELPTSLLPTGPVTPPMDLSFSAYKYFAGQSEHQGLLISWTPPKDVRVDTFVLDVMDPTGGGAFRTVYNGAGTSYDLKDAIGGRWTVRVRSISSDGVPSAWVSRDIQVAMLLLPVPPDSVRVTEGTFDITLSPQSAYPNAIWEFWRSLTPLTSGEIETNATQLPTGTYLVDAGLRAGRTYYYYVRGVNQYGLSAWYAVQGTTKQDFEDIMDHIKEDYENGELGKEIKKDIEIIATGVTNEVVAPKFDEVRAEIEQQRTEIDQTITETKNSLQAQVNQAKTDIQNVNTTLGNRIDSTKTELQGQVTAVKNDLQAQIDAIEDVVDAMLYDPAAAYKKGESVRLGKHLYQALQDVPVGMSPPNATYWKDVGDIAQDLNGLATRVGVAETKITQQGDLITANSSSITRLTADLKTQELENLYNQGEMDSQISDALNIASGAATATQTLNATVTQQGDKITAQGQSITEVTSQLSNLSGTVGGYGTAIESLKTITTAQGNALTSQSERLTSLDNSLTITNTNVTAAQQAANAANTLAGGKGKVLVQSAAPAAADQLAQNLWIDTTGGANTPKRWTGSAWAAVTDKVATDAAAAAANALSVANSKADSSAVSALTTRVTSAEGKITSQGESITSLNNSLTITNSNVTTAQQAADAAATLAGGKGKVLVQSTTPVAADRLPQNLWIDTTGGANTPKRWTGSAWEAVTDKIATDAAAAAADALAKVSTKAEAAAVTALTTRVSDAEGKITSQGQLITQLNNSLTITNTNVTAAQQAANAANTLAGGKGKVLVQSAAPAAADQLPQNLWIDTTGGANTPKRWTGSAWAAVTDKVATDAAAAAADALAKVLLKADASALQLLASTVTQQGDLITANSSSITKLTADLQAQALDNLYNQGETDSQIADALNIATGAATATTALTASVTQQGDKITAQSQQLTELSSTLGNLSGDVVGTVAAIESLKTLTTAQGNTISSQGERLTSLDNSLTITNTNVTAAQQAANAANTLAGGKGKVLVQSAAPAAADQLAQNLWIDTTGGANTPKRWTGSAWAAVTDKVATDAAVAAANALSVANSKADASALQSLTTRVTSAEGLITSQGTSITQLNNSLVTTNTNVTAAQSAADAAATLAGGKGKVLVQPGAPAAADRLAQNLWIDTTGGANTPKRWTGSAWAAVTDKVATDAAAAAANALSVANSKADAAALASLTTRVTNAEGKLTTQGESIVSLNNSLTITNTNVTSAQQAADAANTLAGGKGKVLVQPGTPAAADRLPQNLWIDTTGAANTPKRWTGSAWAAVTDKVATDAAAAASNALAQVATKAEAAALTALTNVVTQQGTDISANSSNLVQLKTDVHFQELDQLYTGDETDSQIADALNIATGAAAATDSLTATVSRQDDKIVAQAQRVTDLSASLSNVEGSVGAQGAAIETLKTLTTAQGNALTSQGESITQLNNSLTITNTNVTAAQQAANAANTLAGGKGKVLVQPTTPVAADRLPQNLWIDTTGGANTPKRWTGSAWTAVTDKVATDAAAAAADALAKVSTKAEAAALNSLTTRVTSAEGTIAAQGQSLTKLNTRVTSAETGITGNATFISQVDAKVTAADGKITALTTRTDGIYAQVNPVLAGDDSGELAGDNIEFVGVWTEQSARIEDGIATGKRIDTVQSAMNDVNASVQTVAQTTASLDGKVGAMYAVKLQVNQFGQYVYAGYGLAIEDGPGGLTSTFNITADKFIVSSLVNGNLNIPFAVDNGNVYIKNAFIQNGSIDMLKIGDNLQSRDYIAGQRGWKLWAGGNLEFNGSVPGGGRLSMNNQLIRVFDGAGTLRLRLGIWG